MLTSAKNSSRLSFILQPVRRSEGLSSLTYSRIPFRSYLVKPFTGNWAVGNESSSFVSDNSSMSTYLVICGDKKPNLFLKELILS